MQSIYNLVSLRSAKLPQLSCKVVPFCISAEGISVVASFPVYCNSDNALAGLIREIRNDFMSQVFN